MGCRYCETIFSNKVTVTINGIHHKKNKCFPSLNDLLAENKKSPYLAAKMKREFTDLFYMEIMSQIKKWKALNVITISMIFREPIQGQKRDHDNVISFFLKVFMDALQKSGKIKDDSKRYVNLDLMTCEFKYVPDDQVGVTVDIYEIGE